MLVRSRAFVPQNNATDVHSVVVVVVVFREEEEIGQSSIRRFVVVVYGETMMMAF